jgi:hypothetical protein
MRKTTLGIAILVATAVVITATTGIYLIRDETGGYALWNESEAYFFITVHSRGTHIRWLRYPLVFASQFLGVVQLPDNERQSFVVVRVTSAGAERHDLKMNDPEPGSAPSMYTPREGRIYANYPAFGGLCVWAGDHFESATLDGRRGFDGINTLSEKDFENKNGWSKRGFAVMAPDADFTIDVGNKFSLLVSSVAAARTGHGSISIDTLYPSAAPSRVFNLDVRNESVSRSEYQQTFHDRE